MAAPMAVQEARGEAPGDEGDARTDRGQANSNGTSAEGAGAWHPDAGSNPTLGATLVVIMGVSGAGKTTIGRRLAQELGCTFLDADDFHSQANREKMRRGVALTDEDRGPWLEALAQEVHRWRHALPAQAQAQTRSQAHAQSQTHTQAQASLILACSALRPSYRTILRCAAADPCPLLARESETSGAHPCPISTVTVDASTEQTGGGQPPSGDAATESHDRYPSSGIPSESHAQFPSGGSPRASDGTSGAQEDLDRERGGRGSPVAGVSLRLDSRGVSRGVRSGMELTGVPIRESTGGPGGPGMEFGGGKGAPLSSFRDWAADSKALRKSSRGGEGCLPRRHWFVLLEGPPEVFAARVSRRQASECHFMPALLIESQFSTLEVDPLETDVVRVDATQCPEAIVKRITDTVLYSAP